MHAICFPNKKSRHQCRLFCASISGEGLSAVVFDSFLRALYIGLALLLRHKTTFAFFIDVRQAHARFQRQLCRPCARTVVLSHFGLLLFLFSFFGFALGFF